MSVVLEFTVESDQFVLGRVLSNVPPMRIELERIVPTGDTVMPFLWVTGSDFEQFERRVSSHEAVEDMAALDKVQGSTLYRVKWHEPQNGLIQGITNAEGTILEAYGDERWEFHVRFPNHDALSQFYNYCTDTGVAIRRPRRRTRHLPAGDVQSNSVGDQASPERDAAFDVGRLRRVAVGPRSGGVINDLLRQRTPSNVGDR